MRKLSALIFFTLFTVLAFSQNINNKDVNIFFEILKDYNYEGYNNYDEEIRKYIAAQIDAISFMLIYIHKMDGFTISIDEIKKLYQYYLNNDVPENIEEIFKKYGWEQNGHKIFWEIFYIGFCFIWCELYFMEGENNEESLDRLLNVKEIFEKNDLEIVITRKEEFYNIKYE